MVGTKSEFMSGMGICYAAMWTSGDVSTASTSNMSLPIHLSRMGVWPPDPDSNYRSVLPFCQFIMMLTAGNRKGHYVVSEYADKVHNRHTPTFPWLVMSFGILGKYCVLNISFLPVCSKLLWFPDSNLLNKHLSLVKVKLYRRPSYLSLFRA